jgi:hypothetical protein
MGAAMGAALSRAIPYPKPGESRNWLVATDTRSVASAAVVEVCASPQMIGSAVWPILAQYDLPDAKGEQ